MSLVENKDGDVFNQEMKVVLVTIDASLQR